MGCTMYNFPRVNHEENLKVGGDVQFTIVHCTTQYIPTGGSVWPLINPPLGMYQKIHASGAINIDSVKIDTSLVVMRE